MERSQPGRVARAPGSACATTRAPPRGGFTLLELLCAIAIAALLLVLSGASVGSWIPRYQQRNAAAALAEALQAARGEALRRNVRVDLCPTLDQATCDPGGRWDAGWMTFVDENGNGKRDAGEPLVRVETPAGARISVTGNKPVASYVSYTPYGHTRLASGALQMGTFTVCKPGQTAIEVVLANGGRPRVQEIAAACP
jgi:type IV fimbrial biogenesis protein FimT